MPPPRLNADPPSMLSRLARLPNQRVRSGQLSIQDAAALAATGFEPISDVIGVIASRDVADGFYSAGNIDPNSRAWRTATSAAITALIERPPSLQALRSRYTMMLNRLVAEAQALGADGVVGIRIERTERTADGMPLRTFIATGTAVRAIGAMHTDQPFTTDLTGAEVASALRSGWVPISLLIVPCMAIRRLDPFSQVWGDNCELYAYTDLVTTCRSQARQEFSDEAARLGADGAVLSDMSLEFEPVQIQNASNVLVCMTGTALARFGPPAQQSTPLTMLRLDNKTKEHRL